MTKFLLHLAINALALYLAVTLLPGVELLSSPASIIGLALIFGLVNALIRPVLKFLTCALILLTLGLFTLVINTGMFILTANIGQWFGINLSIDDPVWWNAFLAALVVSVVNIVMTMILKDELKRK
jgi:putative membrane protein